MYSITLTSLFLMVLTLLTTNQVNRFMHESIEKQLYTNYSQNSRNQTFIQASALIEGIRETSSKTETKNPDKTKEKNKSNPTTDKENGKKRPLSLKVNLNIPPNNARLNFALFIDNPSLRSGNLSCYELSAKLLRHLYGGYSFFKEVYEAEYKILNKLIENQKVTENFQTPDELSKIDFENPELQKIFYLMMKGSNDTPSLLHYISFTRKKIGHYEGKKINFMHTPKVILDIIFDSSSVTNALCELRDKLWLQIFEQERNRKKLTRENSISRSSIKLELHEAVKDILSKHGLSKTNADIFDYSLGKLGDFIFIQDKTTNITIRHSLI